jgi:predicted dehydrogenase
MSRSAPFPRRRFLKSAVSAAVASPTVITSFSLFGQDRPVPSSRLTLGAIGVGGMGSGDLGDFLGRGEVQAVAVCDPDAGHAENAKKMVEGRYAQDKASGKFKGCDIVKDFREVTRRPDIDIVMIATPDHWHALPVIDAARHGKDIHCQKPLSLTIAQGRAMCDAVHRYGRVFQTGSQQRSDRNFRYGCELVRNGRIGKLLEIHVGLPTGGACEPLKPEPVPPNFDYEWWLGPAPWTPYNGKRIHWNFRWILDYSGGQLTDWGAHHIDIAQWGNGTSYSGPTEFEGAGVFPKEGDWDAAINYKITCTYPNGVRMIVADGRTYPNGVKFVGDKGWVFVTRGPMDAEPKSILSSVIGPNEIHLYESHDHKGNFLQCVRTRGETVAPIENAHRSISVAHLCNHAMKLGRKLAWDPAKERFVNDPEADRLLTRAMRPPWHL